MITLLGASWDSEEGDTGEATVHLGINTPSKQRWELTSELRKIRALGIGEKMGSVYINIFD